MSTNRALVLLGVVHVLLALAALSRPRGLPVPPAAAFPDQANSPFGEGEGGIPQVIY